MMKNRQFKSLYLFFLAAAFLLILPYRADAYVDPNTGGFFFTSVLPFVYGIFGAIVIFWKRIASIIKGIFNKAKSDS